MSFVKNMMCILFGICCLLNTAFGDEAVLMKPKEGNPGKEEIKSIISSVFLKKCGMAENGMMEIIYKELAYGLIGHGYVEKPDSTPVWIAIFDAHGEPHSAVVDATGELISWTSHGTEHWRDDPDEFDSIIEANVDPHVCAEEIIVQYAREALAEISDYSKKEIQDLKFNAIFGYEKRFNDGYIPIWLVEICDNGKRVYKAAYGYDGQFMSISPSYAEFGNYRTDLPRFQDTVEEDLNRLFEWGEDSISIEEKAALCEKLQPIVQEWIKKYPYYVNNPGIEYDITVRNVYGVPDEQAIEQSEAVYIAKEYAKQLDISMDFMDTRETIVCYLITDPARPIWRVTVLGASIPRGNIWSDQTLATRYVVSIDAYTGNVYDAQMIDLSSPGYLWRY